MTQPLSARLRRRLALLLGLSLAAASGSCAAGPQASRISAEPLALKRLAIAPFVAEPGQSGAMVEPDGVGVVRARVVEALAALPDLDLVPPEDSDRRLEQARLDPPGPVAIGRELARAFGADSVMFGRVRRYSSRVGGTRGAERPAAVWFELELRAPDGARLWQGSFHEQQQAVSENLLSLPRAAARGFQWLDADQLALEGAKQLAAELDRERQKWK